MTKTIPYLSALVVSAFLLLPKQSTMFRLPVGNLEPQTEISTAGYNHRLVLASDLADIFSALYSSNPKMRLQILFDLLHKDIVREVKNFTEDVMSGMILQEYDGEEATIRQMLTSASLGTTLIVPLCRPSNIVHVFRLIRRKRLDSHFAKWLLMASDSAALDSIVIGLEGVIHEGTRVSLIYKDASGRFLVLTTRVNDEGIVGLTSVGTWRIQNKLIKERNEQLQRLVFPDDEHLYLNMRGRQMRIAANDYAGFFAIDQTTSDGDQQRLLGMDGSIIRTLSQTLNFTYKIIRPADGYWGNPLPDGNITGVIGMAARRETEFSICAIAQTDLRDTVVDFTFPYLIEPLALFTRAPKEKNRVLAVLSPFTSEVWLTIIIATLAIGPVISLQSAVSGWLLKEESSVSLQKFSFNMFRTLVIQGNRLRANRASQRILVISWYLFCVIITALYSGMLTAVLAIPSFEETVDSLTDIPRAVKDGFSIGILRYSSDEMLFRKAESGIYREIFLLFDHENIDESFVTKPEYGVYKAMSGKYIWIGFKISAEILVFKLGRRKFHIGRDNVFPLIIGIAIPPGAGYKSTFDLMLSRIVEGGLFSKWRAEEFLKVSRQASKESDEGTSKNYAINLVHLQAAFIIVVIGITLATIILAIENIYPRLL